MTPHVKSTLNMINTGLVASVPFLACRIKPVRLQNPNPTIRATGKTKQTKKKVKMLQPSPVSPLSHC